MDMKKFHSIVMIASEKFYLKQHTLNFTLFAPLKNEKIMMCAKSFDNNAEKQFTFDMYASLLLLNECEFYSITGEIFFYQTTDMSDSITPSQHPARKEGIFTLSVDRKGKNIPYLREIKNNQFVSEWIPQQGDMFSGNLNELFNRAAFKNPDDAEKIIKHFEDFNELLNHLTWYGEIPLENFLTGVYNA